jgi:hypothetical protein
VSGDDLVGGVPRVVRTAGCPAIVPRCQELTGRSLVSGWRRTVLETLGGTAGCTHVTTLLLGLAEARTSAFFLLRRDQAVRQRRC